MGISDGVILTDNVVAEMVDCTPQPEPSDAPLPICQPEASPVQQAMEATLTQTGADPPPQD